MKWNCRIPSQKFIKTFGSSLVIYKIGSLNPVPSFVVAHISPRPSSLITSIPAFDSAVHYCLWWYVAVPVMYSRKQYIKLMPNSKINTLYEFCRPILPILKRKIQPIAQTWAKTNKKCLTLFKTIRIYDKITAWLHCLSLNHPTPQLMVWNLCSQKC